MTTTAAPPTEPTTQTRPAEQRSPADLLVELTVTTGAVRRKEWLSPEIGTNANPSLDLLGSPSNPLTGLSGAGLDWVIPLISFLAEPLRQLRGNPGPVSSGSQEFQTAAQDLSGTADNYRTSTATETDQWSGEAASGYRDKGTRFADGLSALAESSSTVAGAVAGAGEVVAQVVGIVTGLVAEAVGKIVPIMSKAVAEAPATFGASIAAAIPQCVQIAVDYGGRIAGKLAALLSSGQNLLKLVDGALAVLGVVKQVLTMISEQSTRGGTGTEQEQGETDDEPPEVRA